VTFDFGCQIRNRSLAPKSGRKLRHLSARKAKRACLAASQSLRLVTGNPRTPPKPLHIPIVIGLFTATAKQAVDIQSP